MRISPNGVSLLVSALLLVGCSSSKVEIGPETIAVSNKWENPFEGARPSQGNPWWELDQGWNAETRKAFWFTPQGSQMIPYNWFLYLKNTAGTGRFLDDMPKYGYTSAPKYDQFNPHALPIGFARMPITVPKDNSPGVEWLGPTCSACHSNRMILKDKNGRAIPVLVDGAPALANFAAMVDDLTVALNTTYREKDRFQEFAEKVLVNPQDPSERNALQSQMFDQVMYLANFIEGLTYAGNSNEFGSQTKKSASTNSNDPHTRHGHGRIDAVGAILNQVAGDFIGLGTESNFVAPLAPVSYPFLWGTPQSAVVQWNGFAPNGLLGFGGLVRNVGEVLGVFGCVEIPKDDPSFVRSNKCDPIKDAPPTLGYASSIHISNLGHLENWLTNLRSPQWPEDILPKIDEDLKKAGEKIYAKYCSSCHAVVARGDEGKPYKPTMIEVSVVRTDPKMADNFLLQRNPVTTKQWSSGALKGERAIPIPFLGAAIGPKYGDEMTSRGDALVTVAAGVILAKPFTSLGSALTGRDYAGDPLPATINKRSYKARPLTGIWATAPYLHNGSVASLAELLKPEGARKKAFEVGNPEFDPKNVGYVTEKVAGVESSTFDTSRPGNSNAGHSGEPFGTDLHDSDKAALIEYLKSL